MILIPTFARAINLGLWRSPELCFQMTTITYRLLTIIILCAASTACGAQNLDSIYRVLDMEVARASHYIEAKERSIDVKAKEIPRSRNDEARFEMAFSLYEDYSSYDDVKAKQTLKECLAIAKAMGDRERTATAYAFLAFQSATSGYFTEALHWISMVDTQGLSRAARAECYFASAKIYDEIHSYSDDSELKEMYIKMYEHYHELYLEVADTTSSFYYQHQIAHLIGAGRRKQAIDMCRRWSTTAERDSHDYAIMAYLMSECYKPTDEKRRCYWLAVSAISDCRSAVMNQASLWTLANIVSKQGNLKRSKKYIEYSWMCTKRFGGHTRSWQISPVITAINDSYREALSSNNRSLTILLTVVSVMAMLVMASLLFLYKRNQQLYAARNETADINEKLAALNHRLHEQNQQMTQVNRQLHDSNRVKDEYIARFLSLCSEYIDKLNAYRIKVNRRVIAKQYKELLVMTNSDAMLEEETKELFANFDAVFLKLYPNFVGDFNSLLKPEYHQQIGANNELTTDMRMAALIRLGIDDSAHIAEFLRLSPNTIYNYRARLKSRAVDSRIEFEDRIMEIGL